MKKIFKHLFFLVIYVSFSCNVFSDSVDEYVIKSIDEISGKWISYDVGVSFVKSKTSISLKVSMNEAAETLSQLKVITEWGEIIIPDNILQRLPSPQLDTVNVSYVPVNVNNPDWSFSLRMNFGDYKQNVNNEIDYSLVEFGFGKQALLDVTVFDSKLGNSTILFESKNK